MRDAVNGAPPRTQSRSDIFNDGLSHRESNLLKLVKAVQRLAAAEARASGPGGADYRTKAEPASTSREA